MKEEKCDNTNLYTNIFWTMVVIGTIVAIVKNLIS